MDIQWMLQNWYDLPLFWPPIMVPFWWAMTIAGVAFIPYCLYTWIEPLWRKLNASKK